MWSSARAGEAPVPQPPDLSFSSCWDCTPGVKTLLVFFEGFPISSHLQEGEDLAEDGAV